MGVQVRRNPGSGSITGTSNPNGCRIAFPARIPSSHVHYSIDRFVQPASPQARRPSQHPTLQLWSPIHFKHSTGYGTLRIVLVLLVLATQTPSSVFVLGLHMCCCQTASPHVLTQSYPQSLFCRLAPTTPLPRNTPLSIPSTQP